MIKKIWHSLGNLKLAFWLIISASVILFIGSIYANADFSFFHTLNETRMQDWLTLHLKSDFDRVWWLPLLFIVMGLLSINGFICAVNRLTHLFSQRKKMPSRIFLIRMASSIIHLLFLFILFGHLLTFSQGIWERIPIKEESTFSFDEIKLHITDVQNTYYSEKSGLKNRISQTTVLLNDPEEKNITLTYLRPVYYKGSYLFLDMIKPRKKDVIKKQPITELIPDGENCNKAHIFHKTEPKNNQRLLLLCVSDPGLIIIVTGLTLVLIIMAIYFIALPKE